MHKFEWRNWTLVIVRKGHIEAYFNHPEAKKTCGRALLYYRCRKGHSLRQAALNAAERLKPWFKVLEKLLSTGTLVRESKQLEDARALCSGCLDYDDVITETVKRKLNAYCESLKQR